MGLWDQLRRLVGGPSGQAADNGIYVYLRCDRCGDRVRIRISPTSDLQQEFDGESDRVNGYFVRKMVVDQRCFRPIEVTMRFDASRRETERTIEGGTFLTREAFEAEG